METNTQPTGAFFNTLIRNNKKIRDDRALAIYEDAELLYKRKIEDLTTELKRIQRARTSMLDLSPTTADSLILATDFDSADFVTRDIEMGVKIQNLEITLKIARASYNNLFVGGQEEASTNEPVTA